MNSKNLQNRLIKLEQVKRNMAIGGTEIHRSARPPVILEYKIPTGWEQP